MKKSLYNHLAFIDGSWVLYNAWTDELAILDPEVKAVYEENDVEGIRKAHPDFCAFLEEKRFVVPASEDEAATCVARWEAEDGDPSEFSITVNPTLDCNMRCWYCYEQHRAGQAMSSDVAGRIARLVEQKMAQPQLKRFYMSFFGGEPLLRFEEAVKPLVECACRAAERNGKAVSLSFTTNAFLLTPEVADFLAATGVPVSFQITLDGNRRLHDRTRHTADGQGSYDVILGHCKDLLRRPGMKVTLRCNYTSANAATFMDLPADLEERGIVPTDALRVDFHRVWQDSGADDEVEARIGAVQQALRRAGFRTSDVKAVEKYRCYAERGNHVVVNYDGTLFHCTARDFTPQSAEGVLGESGELLLNEKSALRAKLKWGTEACRRCSVYPLCNGMCSQQKVEHAGETGCIARRGEKERRALAEKRMRYLVALEKER